MGLSPKGRQKLIGGSTMADEGFATSLNEPAETSFVDLGDLSDVPEQHSVVAGEWRVRGISLEMRKQKPEKGTGSYLMALMEIADDPDSKLITHVMMLPAENDPERTKNQRLRAIRDFRVAFGLGTSGPLNFSDFEGAYGYAILVEEEDATYGSQNRVKKFTVPAA